MEASVVNFGLTGIVGMIYIGNHEKLPLTKYISCGPHGFRVQDY